MNVQLTLSLEQTCVRSGILLALSQQTIGSKHVLSNTNSTMAHGGCIILSVQGYAVFASKRLPPIGKDVICNVEIPIAVPRSSKRGTSHVTALACARQLLIADRPAVPMSRDNFIPEGDDWRQHVHYGVFNPQFIVPNYCYNESGVGWSGALTVRPEICTRDALF